MPVLTKERTRARSELASAEALLKRSPDDIALRERVEDLRRRYREVAAADYIKHLVDEAPALSETQRNRLAVLLLAGGAAA